MKQYKYITLLMALVMMAMSPQMMWADGTKPSGSGTTGDPYQITSADELIWFRDAVNGGSTGICARVTADFQVENQDWAGIGTSSKKYTGTFDGNDKTIYIKHLSATGDNFGLFGYINGATIKDLTIAPPNNGNSYAFTSSYGDVGTVVGCADGASKILNVKSSIDLTISGAKSHIGGIVGYIQNTTQVSGCTYSGTINADSSKDCIGGIVGFSYKDYATTITNCFFSGSITTTASDGSTWPDDYVLMGGILGYVNDETSKGTFGGVKNCFSCGTLTAESATKRQGIGAIIGAPRGKAIHDNNVTGNYYINGATALGNNNADNATNKKITISVTAGDNGSVSTSYVNPTTNTSTLLQVKATPNTGYHFGSWSDSGEQTHTVALTDNVNLSATFAINRHTITLKKYENYDYRCKIYVNGTESTGGTYDYGTELTLKAVPDTYCNFSSWKNGNTKISEVAEFTYTVTGDATLTAVCYKTTYTLTLQANNDAWGTVTGGGKYDGYKDVTITATPNEGCHFVNWTKDGTEAYTTATVTNHRVYSDETLVANFAKDQHTITVTSADENMGTVTGGGTYDYGTQQTLTATPKDGYHVESWSDGTNTFAGIPKQDGSNALCITVNGEKTYTATFAAHTYGDWVIDEPNCTTIGKKAKYCTHNGCLAKEEQEIQAEGHKYVNFRCQICRHEPTSLETGTLVDKSVYERTTGLTIGNFTYTRTFESTNWTTWYVPFDFTLTAELAQKYAFSRINNVHQYDDNNDGQVDRTVIESFRQAVGTTIKGNYPYLVKAINDGDKEMTLTLNNATLGTKWDNSILCQSVEYKYTFTGTYSGKGDSGNEATSPYTLFWDGNWYHYHSLDPQRHYLTITPRNSAYSNHAPARIQLKITGEEDATGIVRLYSDERQQTETYDLTGRRMPANSQQRGIRIVNGKKVLVK